MGQSLPVISQIPHPQFGSLLFNLGVCVPFRLTESKFSIYCSRSHPIHLMVYNIFNYDEMTKAVRVVRRLNNLKPHLHYKTVVPKTPSIACLGSLDDRAINRNNPVYVKRGRRRKSLFSFSRCNRC